MSSFATQNIREDFKDICEHVTEFQVPTLEFSCEAINYQNGV